MQKDAGSAATGLLERQCHFTTSRLAKEKSGKDSGGKAKESARAVLLKDQLTKLEEKHKAEMGILEDTQAFVKARGKLEMEYASNLQKLAQTYHNKRKWPVKMHKGSTCIRTLGDSDGVLYPPFPEGADGALPTPCSHSLLPPPLPLPLPLSLSLPSRLYAGTGQSLGCASMPLTCNPY